MKLVKDDSCSGGSRQINFFVLTFIILFIFPLSEARCLIPMDFNGEALYDERFKTAHGAFFNFTCNKGYMLDGPARLICLSNRKWGGTLPNCAPVKHSSSSKNSGSSSGAIAGGVIGGFGAGLITLLVILKLVDSQKKGHLDPARRSYSFVKGTISL